RELDAGSEQELEIHCCFLVSCIRHFSHVMPIVLKQTAPLYRHLLVVIVLQDRSTCEIKQEFQENANRKIQP
ncbi:MAG: hypothetical protein R6V83_11990, partial [Candidatus Thorarchaeota archaeon]